MRKLFVLALALITVSATAQIDRSKLPEPAPARDLKIGDYEKFTLKNGLNVIVVSNDKLPRLSWTLSFITGPITEGNKSGYASIYGQVMRAGTTSKTKAVLDEEIDFMGASVFAGATSISASSLSKYKDEILSIMTDILYNPSFPEDEFERAIEQTLTGLQTAKDNPNAISSRISGVLNYGVDHPYGELTTEETVKNIELDDLKAHYAKYFKPGIAYLVVVGDITKKEARKLVKKYFEDWKDSPVEKEEFKVPDPIDKSIVALMDRPSSVQSVINITYPIQNKPGSEYITKVRVLNQIFGGSGLSSRLNTNLREDKGYTYGANSSMGSSRYSATVNIGASVRNEVTDSAMVEFLGEMKRIREELVTDEELDLAKNFLRGQFARSLESRGTVAQFALNTQLNNLPDDYYNTYLKRLEAITAEDIRETARQFIRPENANIVVVGKADDIAEKLARFGDVRYFNYQGEEYDPEEAKAAVASVDAQGVINKYIDAIGGADKLKTVTDMTQTITAAFQGQTLTVKSFQKENIKHTTSVLFGAFEIQKSVFNNGEAKVTAQGQTQEVQPGPQLDGLKDGAVMFPELFYGETGHKLEMKGIEQINGEDAYVMIITSKAGTSSTTYFSVASGLKLKQEVAGQGAQEFVEYQEVNGIMFPKKLKLSLPGAGVIEGEMAVSVNTGIEEATFSLN